MKACCLKYLLECTSATRTILLTLYGHLVQIHLLLLQCMTNYVTLYASSLDSVRSCASRRYIFGLTHNSRMRESLRT
jgi:hypothetical protein